MSIKKININIKSLRALLAILAIASLIFPQLAWADMFNIGNLDGSAATQSMNQILNDFGLTSQDISHYTPIVKQYESIDQKKQEPQVQVTFSPTDPKPGEEVTASAAPLYFMNDSKNLYFTWYLKTADCTDINDGGKYKYNASCDLNNDGKVNIEDYKTKAMRIIASSGFDWTNENYDSDTSTGNHTYKAVNGGDDQGGKNAHCYFHNVTTGNDYELHGVDKNGDPVPLTEAGGSCAGVTNHLFPNAYDDKGNQIDITGDGKFGKAEEEICRRKTPDRETA